MTDFSGEGGLWAQRFAGASAGSAVSLIHLLPQNRREAASRFLTGLACGLVFGEPAGLWLQHALDLGPAFSPGEIMLSGAAAASLCAWWGMGILSLAVARYQRELAQPRRGGRRFADVRDDRTSDGPASGEGDGMRKDRGDTGDDVRGEGLPHD